MRPPHFKSFYTPDSPKELPLGEQLFLADWPLLKRTILEALGADQWPKNLLSVHGRTGGDGRVLTHKIETEGADVGVMDLKTLRDNIPHGDRLRDELLRLLQTMKKTGPEDRSYANNKKRAAQARHLFHVFDSIFHRHEEGSLLFIVTAKEIPDILDSVKTLEEKYLVPCVVLVVDPPHLWEKFIREAPDICFLEMERRIGHELISPESRQWAKNHILDLLAPLAHYAVPNNGLVRAMRKQIEPASDIAIERDVLNIVQPRTREDEKPYEKWRASQSEREEHWKQYPPRERAEAARIIEAYIRPREGEIEQFERLPEVYGEIILRLVALDPDCLPPTCVARAKNFFQESIDSSLNELEKSMQTGAPEPPRLRKVLMLKADNLLLQPSVNDVFGRLLDFRARTCVEAWEKYPEARSSFFKEETLLRIERAAQVGCDVSDYRQRLEAYPEILEARKTQEAVSMGTTLLELNKAITSRILDDDMEGALELLEEKDDLLSS